MKLKPLDVPTASTWMNVPEERLRADATYDPRTDRVKVPALIVDRVEINRATEELKATVKATLLPSLIAAHERMNRALARFNRRSRY